MGDNFFHARCASLAVYNAHFGFQKNDFFI